MGGLEGSIEARVYKLAAKQRGLVTSEQCHKLGLLPNAVARRVEKGVWQRVARGLFSLKPGPLDRAQKELAAVLMAGPGACLSHLTAARLLGLDVPPSSLIQVSVPNQRRVRSVAWAQFIRSSLDPADVTRRQLLPITHAGRTLLDVAGTLDPKWLRACVDSALRLRASNLLWARRALDRHGRGLKGAGTLRALLSEYVPGDAVSDSVLESFARELCFVAGRLPVLHYSLTAPDGRFIAELDYAWPEARFAVELDGWSFHGAKRAAFDADLSRLRRIGLAGWLVHRFSFEDVTLRPDQTRGEITKLYDLRMASLASHSPF